MDTAGGEEFDRVIAQLHEIIKMASELSNKFTENKVWCQEIFEKVLSQVKQTRKDINEAFDRLENKIETEGKNIRQKDEERLNGNIQSCDKLSVKADNLTSQVSQLRQKGQNCNLFVSIKTNQQEIQSLQHTFDTLHWDNVITEDVFQPSEQLQNFIKHRGNLGQLRLASTTTNVGRISVRVKSDRYTYCIRGLAMITSGRLVAADNYNEKLKLIDTHNSRVLSEYQIPSRPWDITSTEEAGELAVTVPHKRQVLLLRLRGDSLYLYKTIQTTGQCYGVTSVKDKLVVSLPQPWRLEIMTNQGSVLHTIEKDEKGQQLFSEVLSLCVNQNTETVYVPDLKKQTVTSVSMSGQVLGIYRDSDLKGARGVTIDPYGSVYVCGVESNNVHQITPDCRKLGILLSEKDGLSGLCSLCYDKDTNRLYVGQTNYYIKVFQMT